MASTVSLRAFVKRRNGVPLGGKHALPMMLKRSLGAPSFADFWHYWNPIWGYYLSRFVMRPLRRYLPAEVAILLTFAVSGALHDVAVSLIKQQWIVMITPWFSVMGLFVIVLTRMKVNYPNLPIVARGLVNVSWLVLCYWLTTLLLVIF